jgi:hypothetical protein
MLNFKIVNHSDPVNDLDVVNKKYVDTVTSAPVTENLDMLNFKIVNNSDPVDALDVVNN